MIKDSIQPFLNLGLQVINPAGLKQGTRDIKDKPDLSYCSLGYEVMVGEAAVWAYGDKVKGGSHDRGNWLTGFLWTLAAASLRRHVDKFLNGQDLDVPWGWKEGDKPYDKKKYSGLPHVDHIVCCAKILSNTYHTRPDLDNRGVSKDD